MPFVVMSATPFGLLDLSDKVKNTMFESFENVFANVEGSMINPSQVHLSVPDESLAGPWRPFIKVDFHHEPDRDLDVMDEMCHRLVLSTFAHLADFGYDTDQIKDVNWLWDDGVNRHEGVYPKKVA